MQVKFGIHWKPMRLQYKNWMKYNGSTSPKVVNCIKSELCSIKDRVLIEYVDSIYAASQ